VGLRNLLFKKASSRFERFGALFIVAYAVLASIIAADARDVEAAYAAPASELIYDWVDESVEAELSCQVYKQCLHIEVVDTKQCTQSVVIQMGYEDMVGRFITTEDLIVPSPRFAGGFVIEVGSNMRPEIGLMGVWQVSCSASAPNVFGEA
jgi:hypothetical protein